jgi:hypothetical protein
MYQPKCLSLWARILLAAALCWSGGSAFAQNPKANPNANHKAQTPIKLTVKNLNQQRRQNALDELAATTDARIQVDRQYRAYIEAVDKHNKHVDEFVKAHKGGVK